MKEEPPMHPKSANDTSYICERSRQVHYAQRHRKEKVNVRHLQSVTISNNKARGNSHHVSLRHKRTTAHHQFHAETEGSLADNMCKIKLRFEDTCICRQYRVC